MSVLLLLLLACGGPTEPECTTTVECGALQACLGGECVDVECRSGADCELQNACDAETYTCVPGCASSDDCLVGDRCDVEIGTCVPRACRDTQRDCALGERCDATSGRCELDPAPHCQPCRSDEACGPDGECLQFSRSEPPYCVLPCSPEAFDPCPAGMQCTATTTADGQPGGFRCVGLCGAL